MGQLEGLRTLDWHVPVPTKQPVGIKIEKVVCGHPLCGWILHPTLFGCFTHYLRTGTLPCIGRDNGCEFCGPHASRRWQGYLGIYDARHGRMAVAPITKEAARTNDLLAQPGTNLRGLYLRLERIGDKRNAPVRAFIETRDKTPTLPAPFNMQELLCAVWGFHPQAAGFEVPPSVRKEPANG